jgi:transposase
MMEVFEKEQRGMILPDDIEVCHGLIRELWSLVENKDGDILYLKQRLQDLLRDKFGRSSEKLSPGQLLMFGQEVEDFLRAGEPEVAGKEGEKGGGQEKLSGRKNGGGGRKPIAANVRRERKHYFPEEEDMVCQCCGGRKQEVGVVVLDQLDYVPASFKVIEHATHKFACRECQEGMVEGERPAQIHNGGKAAEGLISQIATAKWADHLPLHRQEKIYAREGVEIARSSMGRWLDMSARAAKPITDRMHELILQCRVIQADESPVNFLDKNRLPKKSKTGYAWAYYGDEKHPYVLYDLQPDRTAERPKEILRGYTNFLLTDGYGGYDWFDPERSANCNVHARRYFEKALKYDKKKSGMVLALYSELYKIEARIKGSSAEEIISVRQSESLPILNQMKALLVEWQVKTPPKTTLGIAINYALARWEKLCQFTRHAFLSMDTNLVENAIRPIALGRKNWLAIGSEEALETASILASLVNTCKRLGINPFLYLRDIFIRLGREDVCIDDLLPDRWVLENPLDQFSASAATSAAMVS